MVYLVKSVSLANICLPMPLPSSMLEESLWELRLQVSWITDLTAHGHGGMKGLDVWTKWQWGWQASAEPKYNWTIIHLNLASLLPIPLRTWSSVDMYKICNQKISLVGCQGWWLTGSLEEKTFFLSFFGQTLSLSFFFFGREKWSESYERLPPRGGNPSHHYWLPSSTILFSSF